MKNIMLLLPAFFAFTACKKTVSTLSNDGAVINVETENISTTAEPFKFTFDMNREKWRLDGDVDAYYSFTAGYPGGCIYGVDQSIGIYWYFTAPEALVSKIKTLNAYNHTLKYDLKAPSNGTNEPDVIVESDKLKLVFNNLQDPNNIGWTSYNIPFNDLSGWRKESLTGPLATKAEIKEVLRNLQKWSIRGEYFVGGDTGYLDNVTYE